MNGFAGHVPNLINKTAANDASTWSLRRKMAQAQHEMDFLCYKN
jgi:hypothetical protein